MGADLIGNFIFIPQKPTTNDKEVVKKHIDKVEAFTNKRKPIEWARLYVNDDKEVRDFLNEMSDLAYELEEEVGSGDEGDFEYVFEKLKDEYLPAMKSFYETWEIESGRDTAYCTVLPLGNPITVMFGGEQSWGYEPEGIGYQWTKKIYRGGLGDILNKISFPSSASSHFIKDDE